MAFVWRLLQRLGVPQATAIARPGGTSSKDDNMSGHRRYLEFVGGTSAKFYAAVLRPDADDTWLVAFNFGRTGFPRAWATKIADVLYDDALRTFEELLDEKEGKGYVPKAWPESLGMPAGSENWDVSADLAAAGGDSIYRSDVVAMLPPDSRGLIGGVPLPKGLLFAPSPDGGARGPDPVLWISEEPIYDIANVWSQLAVSFNGSGLWPLIVPLDRTPNDFDGYLMDTPGTEPLDAASILRGWWAANLEFDDGEFDQETYAPLGRRFPGLARAGAGERPSSVDDLVRGLEGRLGLVAVSRPADGIDAIGWPGAVNMDAQPADLSAVLRSWEDRFDAYLVGLGTDTMTLAVGRPAENLRAAMRISAEHLAFCPDNIWQGVGTVAEYAPLLVGSRLWKFWWD